MSTGDLPLTISWFPTAKPTGPAIGDPEHTTWGAFCKVFWWRREGEKDGRNFVPSRFELEADGRHVRRLKANVIERTAIALDIEMNQSTGELPPTFVDAVRRLHAAGLAGIVYTSHNHKPPLSTRYRLVLPLAAPIAPEIPVPKIVAEKLDLLGVLDRSKVGASSLFYLPSSPEGALDLHETIIVAGDALQTAWIDERAQALASEAGRIADEAHAEAAARRAARIAEGSNPDDSLIEKLRPHLDLDALLRAHGYDRFGSKYRHPNSTSGQFGADIKVFGGTERVFSHNGGDKLHASNLPTWCDVTALDAIDATIILDFSGDRTRGLRELAERFGLSKAEEQKQVARLVFKMLRCQASQDEIEAAASAEGQRLGLSFDEVCRVASWVVAKVAT